MSKNPIRSNILSDRIFINGCNCSSGGFSWLHTKQLAILKISNDFFYFEFLKYLHPPEDLLALPGPI